MHGPAIAGGAGLAVICDFTLATPEAKFGFTEVRIGFVPALVSAFLAIQIGGKHSRDLLLTGRILGAEEAHRMGLVNEVVPHEQLASSVQLLAETLAGQQPAIAGRHQAAHGSQNKAWLDAAIEAALEANAQSRETADFREGVSAFLEKRKAGLDQVRSWSQRHHSETNRRSGALFHHLARNALGKLHYLESHPA